jgi:hypothetical protein
MAKNMAVGLMVFAVMCLIGIVLYAQDWTQLRPWLNTPLREITLGDAFVALVVYAVLRK